MQIQVGQLYKDAGVNPLAGCLPTLATLPVWIGLYRYINDRPSDASIGVSNAFTQEPMGWSCLLDFIVSFQKLKGCEQGSTVILLSQSSLDLLDLLIA